MKTKIKLLPLILLFGVALISFSCRNSNNQYDASGTFEADEVLVSSEMGGKILQLNLTEGQKVASGERVGFVDTTQLYLKKIQLQIAKQALNSRKLDVNKQVAALKEQIATAQHEKKRVEKLLQANVANTKQLDDINAQIATLEKQLDAQTTSMETANESLTQEERGIDIQIAQIEDQLKKCIITVPRNGTVLGKYAEMGEVAVPGRVLFKVADIDSMTLKAYVTSSQLTKLAIGQKVSVFADFGEKDQKEYSGTIVWIAAKSEFTPKTIQTQDERANLVYAVKIRVVNDGLLKIGMYGSVKF